jgi:hypothetical protein
VTTADPNATATTAIAATAVISGFGSRDRELASERRKGNHCDTECLWDLHQR